MKNLRERLEQLQAQRESHARSAAESQRQVVMHDGAIAFCQQLIAEEEAGETEAEGQAGAND